ncbi:MAG TPA: hypothetical protein VMW35_22610 [Myxococcota bacterium]|jgi:hypothetical protein|nr:hypothetical protein [Myxococcota bacterium]
MAAFVVLALARRTLQDAEWEIVHHAVARLRARVMAAVFAMVGGGLLFVATAWLLLRGGPNVGAHLGLLRHYFPGYSVTWTGALVGLCYGAVVGAALGFSMAWLYNRVADLRRPG